MKPNILQSERGFSLTEILVATGIFGIVLLTAGSAYKYFTTETKKEFVKMDSISEFNQLTKDLMKFTEGAGISTAYLNFPVKIKNCEWDTGAGYPKEPCVAKVEEGKLIEPDPSKDFPASWLETTASKCTQFFKDGRGTLVQRRAFPGKPRSDLINMIEDKQLKPAANIELVATWPLIDEKSPPFLMMKLKDAGMYLTMLKGPPSEISRGTNIAVNSPAVQHSFFESVVYDADSAVMDKNINAVMNGLNVPYLIYNAYLTNHYTIQYASEIISCHRDPGRCTELLAKTGRETDGSFARTIANPSAPPATINQSNNDALSQDLDTKYPANVFAVNFKPVQMGEQDTDSYFKKIFQKPGGGARLPADCLSSWDPAKQGVDEYFFPSKAYSVFGVGSVADDIAGADPLNVLHLSHYYTGVSMTGMSAAIAKGVMMAVPIDIITYRVLSVGTDKGPNKKLELVASRWYPPGTPVIRPAIRIPNLKKSLRDYPPDWQSGDGHMV